MRLKKPIPVRYKVMMYMGNGYPEFDIMNAESSCDTDYVQVATGIVLVHKMELQLTKKQIEKALDEIKDV